MLYLHTKLSKCNITIYQQCTRVLDTEECDKKIYEQVTLLLSCSETAPEASSHTNPTEATRPDSESSV